MALAPVLVTPPATAVVTTTEAKQWLRVDFTDDDTLVDGMITAAVATLEGRHGLLGRCLVEQTWRQDFDGWGEDGELRLPFFGVSAVVVKYFDSDNVEQTVSSSLYELLEDEQGSYVSFLSDFSEPAVYARSDAVRITMTCGFGAATAVPEPIKVAIKMLVAHWYSRREAAGDAQSETPMGVMHILAPYRSIHV